MKRLLTALASALLATAAVAAYPDKPVTIVVPFAAGGPTDKVARDLGVVLSKHLNNQTVIIENVGGAGGTLGAARVAKAAPDGYTLLLHHIGMATSPALYRKMPYDTMGDFEFLGMVNDVPMTIVARPTLPANTMPELVKWLEANKGKINLANAGLGAASHLCGLLFQQSLKIDMTTVPYKGTGPAMTDLMGGQVDIMCDQTTNTAGQIRSGAIKAYAVTTPERVEALPDLPTTAEAGLPEVQVAVWHGLYVPAKTSDEVVAKLTDALQVALVDPNVIDKLADLGTTPVAQDQVTPDAHRAKLTQQIELWTPIIKGAGVKGG